MTHGVPAPFPSGINIEDRCNIFKTESFRKISLSVMPSEMEAQVWNMEQREAVAEIKHTTLLRRIDFPG
jgi:hypothetical protein